MRVHHIGYAVKSIQKSKQSFLNLGYREEGSVVYDELRKINILFLSNDGYRVELVEPADEEAPVYNILKKSGNTPYHICYYSEDIERDAECLENMGYLRTSEIEQAVAIDKKRVCFLYKRDIGIIELVET